MCQQIFQPENSNANRLNILVHFATTMISQRLSLQSVAPSVTVSQQFKWGVLSSPILGVRIVSGLQFPRIERTPTTSQYFSISIQSFTLSSAIWPQFQCQILTPYLGSQGGPRGSKMVPIAISYPHFYSTSIHTIGLSCTVQPEYTTRQTTDRQSDRKGPMNKMNSSSNNNNSIR